MNRITRYKQLQNSKLKVNGFSGNLVKVLCCNVFYIGAYVADIIGMENRERCQNGSDCQSEVIYGSSNRASHPQKAATVAVQDVPAAFIGGGRCFVSSDHRFRDNFKLLLSCRCCYQQYDNQDCSFHLSHFLVTLGSSSSV